MRTALRYLLSVVSLVSALCARPSAGQAQVTLPNGTQIPANANHRTVLNGTALGTPARPRTVQLSQNPATFVNEGLADNNQFATEPQLFSPLCDFSVRFIYKGGGAHFGIGWYNESSTTAARAAPPRCIASRRATSIRRRPIATSSFWCHSPRAAQTLTTAPCPSISQRPAFAKIRAIAGLIGWR